MKTSLTLLTIAVLTFSAGCQKAESKKELLSVDFQKDKTLRYKFNSHRDIEMNWGSPKKEGSEPGPQKVEKFTESAEYVMAYTPVELNPYGLSKIKAQCESIKAQSSHSAGRKNAVEEFAGKSFTFSVSPGGKIEDKSELDNLIKEVGQKAFRLSSSGKPSSTKEPDTIGDFVASQWFLWDSVSSIENLSAGVRPGQSWKSILSVPTPWVSRWARNVDYTLTEIRPTEKGKIAVISSAYSPAEKAPSDWPVPYSGSFQMSGTFGFLVNYKLLELQGSGEELYNIDTGQSESYKQQFEYKSSADLRMPLGINPVITVKQTLAMQRLEQ